MTFTDLDDEVLPQLVPFTPSTSRPPPNHRLLDVWEQQIIKYLITVKACPAADLVQAMDPQSMARMVLEKRVFLQRSAIGAILQVGYPGPPFQVPFHRSPNELADLLYLRLAVRHTQFYGYQSVRRMGRLGHHLVDDAGVRHVLVGRISAGPISPSTVSRLLHDWQHDFAVTRGHLIVATTQPQLYRRLRNHRNRLEVWHFDPTAAWKHLETEDGFWFS